MSFIKPALVALMLLALSGCAVFENIERAPVTTELITNQLTLRLISGADDPVARAAKIREKVASYRSGLSGEYTLSDLEAKVRGDIDWQDYSMADQELLNFAITKAGQTIESLIGDGVLNPQDKATVDTLFRWIDNAAMRVQ